MNARLFSLCVSSLALLPACGGSGGGSGGSDALAAPTNLHYAEDFSVYLVDLAHAPNAASVEGTVTNWSSTPALPTGLSLDPDSGAIQGTAQVSAAHARYTIRAANNGGFTEAEVELSVAAPERHVCITSSDDSTITILGIDAANGALTRRGFVVCDPAEANPEQFAAHPSGRFGYSTSPLGRITCWTIDVASGWLERAGANSIEIGEHALAITPDGRFLYVTNRGGNHLSSFRVDELDGHLSAFGGDVAVGAQPVAVAMDPLGELLFVGNHGDASSGVGSMLTIFSIDKPTGQLTQLGSPLLLNGAKPADLVVGVRRDVVYVALRDAGRVLAVAFDRETGDMSSLGSALSGLGCAALVLDPFERFVWAVNPDGGSLTTLSIQPGGGLDALAEIPAGNEPTALALDPVGRFLLALDATGQELTTFDLDAKSGAPIRRQGWLSRGHPVHVTFVPGEHALVTTPRFLYAAAQGSSDITSYTVTPADGSLHPSALAFADDGPAGLSVDPRQRFVFSANADAHTIGRYRVDQDTGVLVPLLPATAVDGVPTRVAVDGSGRVLYVSTRDVLASADGWVSTWAIDELTGALTLLDRVEVGHRPSWVGPDPTGQFLYVANNGDGTAGTATISIFRIATASGLPTTSAPVQAAPGAWGLAFTPDGKNLYAALRSANVTVPFSIHHPDGTLQLAGSGVRAGLEPMSIVVTPDCRFACVAYREAGSTGTIGVYAIDPATGALVAPATLFTDGLGPVDLALDANGRFLYAANSGSDSVSAFALDPASGFLTTLTPVASGLVPSALLLLSGWQ